jgi:hypothetical protein
LDRLYLDEDMTAAERVDGQPAGDYDLGYDMTEPASVDKFVAPWRRILLRAALCVP